MRAGSDNGCVVVNGRAAVGRVAEFAVPVSELREPITFRVIVTQPRDGQSVELERIPRLQSIACRNPFLDHSLYNWSL
jgi:hypothetical protein